jgi:hypothetical protein
MGCGKETIMLRRRLFLLAGLVIILVPVVGLGWWLLSPLILDKSVDEDFPFALNAVVPPDMTRAEVNETMATTAQANQEVNESVPDPMMIREMGSQATSGGTPEAVMSQPAVVQLKRGNFRDADRVHQGSGQVAIYQGPDGSHLLRLEDFQVTNGPDLHVLLSSHPNPESRDQINASGYVDLGSLKGNIGNQNYPIPEDVDVANQKSVIIYCKPFHVIFSIASLQDLG